jgi:hypothetical protein
MKFNRLSWSVVAVAPCNAPSMQIESTHLFRHMISADVDGSPFFGLLPNHGFGAEAVLLLDDGGGGGVGVGVFVVGAGVGSAGFAAAAAGDCACSPAWLFFFLAIASAAVKMNALKLLL